MVETNTRIRENITITPRLALVAAACGETNGHRVESDDGTIRHYLYEGGPLHRDDGPAVEDPRNGRREYWDYGERHREDGPAVETPNRQEFWCHGLLHRTDGPAIITPSASHWYRNGFAFIPRAEDPPPIAA